MRSSSFWRWTSYWTFCSVSNFHAFTLTRTFTLFSTSLSIIFLLRNSILYKKVSLICQCNVILVNSFILRQYRDYLWNVHVFHCGDLVLESNDDFYKNHWMFHVDRMIYCQQNYPRMLYLHEATLERELHST